jgi:hypothetical protein
MLNELLQNLQQFKMREAIEKSNVQKMHIANPHEPIAFCSLGSILL